MTNLLANAIGKLAANVEGLWRVVLPRNLSFSFREEVKAAATSETATTILVGDGPGEISPRMAISYRTPEGGKASTVLFVVSDYAANELKSLETTVRDFFVDGLPGGVLPGVASDIHIEAVCIEVVKALKAKAVQDGSALETHGGQVANVQVPDGLEKAIQSVSEFLAAAYQSYGNDNIEWVSAFWQHLDFLCSNLVDTIGQVDSGHFNAATQIAYLAAGLPLPEGEYEYEKTRTGKVFAEIIRRKWQSVEGIEAAILDLENLSAIDPHPIRELNWKTISSSRASFGHPILAFSSHGYRQEHQAPWRTCWAQLLEGHFFETPEKEKVLLHLFAKVRDGEYVSATPISRLAGVENDGGDIFLLPTPNSILRDDGVFVFAQLRIKIEYSGPPTSSAFEILPDVIPSSFAKVSELNVCAADNSIEIELSLERKVGGSFNWRDTPITLTLQPKNVVADDPIREKLLCQLIIPNPVQPTIFGIERGGKGFKLQHHAPARVSVLDDNSCLTSEVGEAGALFEISFNRTHGQKKLVCVNTEKIAKWSDDTALSLVTSQDGEPSLSVYTIDQLPDDSIVSIENYRYELSVPSDEAGYVSPIIAAISGGNIVSVSGETLEDIKQDPRYELEKYFRDEGIVSAPSDCFKRCLGTVLVAANVDRTTGKMKWSEEVGSFTDISSRVNAKFPCDVQELPEIAHFWASFEALKLGTCAVDQGPAALPSALDLTLVSKEQLEQYLDSYLRLLDKVTPSRAMSAWLAYPFSALIYDVQRGQFKGVLLSPLHPLRLAWNWGAQVSSSDLSNNEIFQQTAKSFLRFVDGDNLPMIGPSLDRWEPYLAFSLASGPSEFFSAWSMLAPETFHNHPDSHSLFILGARLPLGAPSGLDRGGVTSAIKDYLRVFPFTPQMRIGLASNQGKQRFQETDEAVVQSAAGLLQGRGEVIPGGVRVMDSNRREGSPPKASSVLRNLHDTNNRDIEEAQGPVFEWSSDEGYRAVDLRILEDSPIHVDLRKQESHASVGSTGPARPVNRFRSWFRDCERQSFSIESNCLSGNAYEGLNGYRNTLQKFEQLPWRGFSTTISTQLHLGEDLMSGNARWTIMGNRHLSPSSLAAMLKDTRHNIVLWEWRPAFLSRNEHKGLRSSVSSSQPYTVLARTNVGLSSEIASQLSACDVGEEKISAKDVIGCLGNRGVGLVSLLTMGHTQSMGAIGFFLGFKCLEEWERANEIDEVRCIVPIDSVFPLLDALAVGAKEIDGQRRADLLLVRARRLYSGSATICFHPIELKARSTHESRFPNADSQQVKDSLEQLASTYDVLNALKENFKKTDGKLDLINSAIATLLEAAFSLKPQDSRQDVGVETEVIEAAARGRIKIHCTYGTLMWFVPGALGLGGRPFEVRSGGEDGSGQLYSTFSKAITSRSGDEFSGELLKLINSSTEWPDHSVVDLVKVVTSEANGASPSPIPASGTEVTKDASTSEVSDTIELDNEEDATISSSSAGEEANAKTDMNSKGIRILIGEERTTSRPTELFLNLSDTALSQLNIGVVGDLGTGKTQFLKSLVYQLTQSTEDNRGHTPKAFIFDYKQDYSSGEFPEAIAANVLDPTKTLPTNFFALEDDASQVDKVRRANFFSDMLDRISSIGMVQKQLLYESIMQAYQDCPVGYWPLLEDIFEIYRQKKDGKPDTVISVLSRLRDLQVFESKPENVCSFSKLYRGNTVLNLSTMGAGQDVVDVLATMFLDHLYHDYMKSVPKAPFVTGDDGITRRQVDSYILIDEAHHAMAREFEVLEKLMLEGREFGLGVILSSQFLSHFQTSKHDWSEALSTWVVHNVRNAKPRDFEKIGFRGDTNRIAEKISSLKTHWAYYRCANGQNNGVLIKGQPFYSLPDRC